MLPIVSDCSYLAPRQKLDFTPQNQQLHYEASKTSSGDIGSSASYSNHPFEGVFQIEDRVWRPLYSEQQTDSIRRFWILIGKWLKITSWIDHIWRKFWKGLGLFSAWEKKKIRSCHPVLSPKKSRKISFKFLYSISFYF